jgi:hypothetical protein
MEGGDKAKDKGRATKLKSASSKKGKCIGEPSHKEGTKESSCDLDIVAAASDVTAASIVVPEPQAQSETQLDVVASTTRPEVATDDVDDRDNVAHDI